MTQLLLSPVGILVFVIIALLWPVPALIQDSTIWKVWYAETIGRAQGEMGDSERQPFYFYLWNVLWLILPWTLLAVVGAGAGIKRIRTRRLSDYPFAQFLICWFFIGLFLVSLSAWKHKHYIIPILPAISPAAAIGAIVWLRHQYQQPRWRTLLGGVIWTLACVGGAIAFHLHPIAKGAVAERGIVLLLVVMGLGGAVVLLMEYFRRAKGQLAALFATTGICIVLFMTMIEPHFDGYRASADLAGQATQFSKPGETIWLLGVGECQAAYYLPMPIRRIEPDKGALDLAPIVKPAVALTLGRYLPALSQSADVQLLDPGVDIDDPDRSSGKRKDKLVAVRISPRNSSIAPSTRPVLVEEKE